MAAARLESLLRAHRVDRGHPVTHTSLSGGRYYLPSTAHDAFADAYVDAVTAGAPVALVEQHRHIGPLAIDLDLRGEQARRQPEEAAAKLYEPRNVVRFVNALFAALDELVQLPDGCACYVLEKPARFKNTKDGSTGTVKDGVHLVVPGVVSRPELFHLLRADLLAKVNSIFCMQRQNGGGGGVTNAPEDVYDAATIERAGWMMYGSKKPDEPHAWRVTRVLAFDPETGAARDVTAEEDLAPGRLARLLSIRNKYDEAPPLTPAGAARLAEAVQAREEERVRRMEHEEHEARARAEAEGAASGQGQGQGHGDLSADCLRRLVGMLAPSRARPYETWAQVLFCLNNVTRNGEDGRRLFHAFSATAGGGVYDAAACDRAWSRTAPRQAGGGGLGVGSLRAWAREDSPEEYAAWVAERRAARAAAHVTPAAVEVEEQLEPDKVREAAVMVCAATGLQPPAEVRGWKVEGEELGITVQCKQCGGGAQDAAAHEHEHEHEQERRVGLCPSSMRVSLDREPRGFLHNTFQRLMTTQKMPIVFKGQDPHVPWGVVRFSEEVVLMFPIDALNGGELRQASPRVELVFPDDPGLCTVRLGTGPADMTPTSRAVKSQIVDAYVDSLTKAAHSMGLGQLLVVINNNGIVNNGTIINNNSSSSSNEESEFDVIRVKMMAYASGLGLRKADGFVYEPVEGCPCAVRERCDYKAFINAALKGDSAYMRTPRRFREAVEFLENYFVDEMPELVRDADLLSFANGVLNVADMTFVPYEEVTDGSPLLGRVARHHIPLPYTGEPATPLLDSVFAAQGFGADTVELIYALCGRLLFPVGKLDNWQVMPFFYGLAGTGKSLVLNVIEKLFAPDKRASLGTSREKVFGLDNIADKHVIFGRDMPEKLSEVLPQEVVQSMVSGEGMEVARKAKRALHLPSWTAPVVMASNHMPDFKDTGNNLGRRFVVVRFDRVITDPREDLQDAILGTELPNVAARILRAYLDARQRARAAGGFWKIVPQQMMEWRTDLKAATNSLYAFLSMDEDALRECGVTLRRVEGRVTWEEDLKAAFQAAMDVGTTYKRDPAVFQQFGYTLSPTSDKRPMVCRSCKQIATGRPKCCPSYNKRNRSSKVVIFNMDLGTTSVGDSDQGGDTSSDDE